MPYGFFVPFLSHLSQFATLQLPFHVYPQESNVLLQEDPRILQEILYPQSFQEYLSIPVFSQDYLVYYDVFFQLII